MNQFGFQWPEKLNCDRFPMDQDEEMCIGENLKTPVTTPPVSREIIGMDFQCPTHFQIPSDMKYELQVGYAVVKNCGAPCDGMFFDEKQTSFSRALLAIVGGVCIVPTLFTVITFLLDMQRFQYPERPIIFMSLCYLFISCCYVIGYFQGTSISCTESFSPPTADLLGEGRRMISPITQGVQNQVCTIMFMVVYMFTMAAAIWWVILTLAWFLMAGLKWSHEAVENYSAWFHVAAWAVPAVKSIVVLATESVEGEQIIAILHRSVRVFK